MCLAPSRYALGTTTSACRNHHLHSLWGITQISLVLEQLAHRARAQGTDERPNNESVAAQRNPPQLPARILLDARVEPLLSHLGEEDLNMSPEESRCQEHTK